MKKRDTYLLELRGDNLGTIDTNSSIEEVFQNKTLRPILKLQNELLLLIFINYAIKQKNIFFTLKTEEKINYIENVIQKDFKFRNFLIGIVISIFTIEEYNAYNENTSSNNKRIINLLLERLKSQVEKLKVDISLNNSIE